ncbi:MAG: hypothetical protein N2Z74_05135 [Syntrophales bacterium]|nr:hypothetical protein [Syntrophales bacterium]
MNSATFHEGSLQWQAASMTSDAIAEQFLQQTWDDGFLAFSDSERRLDKEGFLLLTAALKGRADAVGGPTGYLMEAGLWRNRGAIVEELSLEREGEVFFVQYWRLTRHAPPEAANCYWREAATFVRGNLGHVFVGNIKTLEVIVPDHRLRLYLTEEAGA